MSRNASVLITGASGEIGHGLIARLAADDPARPIITLDLNPLPADLAPKVRQQFTGSILDTQLLERIIAEYEVDRVYHLAALLSTRSEFSPGTRPQGERRGDAEHAGVRPEAGREPRPAGRVLLPVEHRGLRAARPRRPRPRRAA